MRLRKITPVAARPHNQAHKTKDEDTHQMKNMLLAVMHEHFQEMKPEKLRKRRTWKMMEIVVCDEYVLKHIMKY